MASPLEERLLPAEADEAAVAPVRRARLTPHAKRALTALAIVAVVGAVAAAVVVTTRPHGGGGGGAAPSAGMQAVPLGAVVPLPAPTVRAGSQPGLVRQNLTFHTQLSNGRVVHVEYDVEHIETLTALETAAGVMTVACSTVSNTTMVFNTTVMAVGFNSSAAALAASASWRAGTLLAVHGAWSTQCNSTLLNVTTGAPAKQ